MPIAKDRLPILLLVLASYLMLVVDVSIVITGLPRIRDSLGFTPAGLSWVHSAYTLTFGGFLLLGARAGDLLGRRRMFLLAFNWQRSKRWFVITVRKYSLLIRIKLKACRNQTSAAICLKAC